MEIGIKNPIIILVRNSFTVKKKKMFLSYSLVVILCQKIGQHSEPEVFRDLEAEVWSVMGKYCKLSDMWL